MSSMVQLDQVSVRFGDYEAVRELSLEVESGEMLAIVGATGAGKSTVLSLILGNLPADSGSVTVGGVDPRTKGDELRGRVSVAFQQPSLLPWRSTLRNVSVGPEILGWDKTRSRASAQAWLGRVGLRDAAEKYPYQLSGGMRQRASLARALVIEPDLLLLDEAFSALDEYTARTLRADFRNVISEAGVTCILVTHNLREAFEMANRVVVFGAPAVIVKDYRASEHDFQDGEFVDGARAEIHQELSSGVGFDA